MNKELIKPYDWHQTEKSRSDKEKQEYIKRTTIADTSTEVRKFLKRYLKNNYCLEETKRFIKLYLNNISLLNKTKIVHDGSYRNCVILIRPDTVYATHSGGFSDFNKSYKIDDLLQYFLNNAETIFLNYTNITFEEDMKEWEELDQMYNEECYN